MYKVCPSCGFMYDDVDGTCPQCQNNNTGDTSTTQVLNLTSQSDSLSKTRSYDEKTAKNKDFKKLVIIISAVVIALVIISVSGFAIYSAIETKRQNEYNSSVSGDSHYNEVGYDEYKDLDDDYFEENYNALMYMPNLVGKHVDDIEDYLGSFYRNVRYEYEFSDEFDKEYIIRQNIDETEELTPYSEIVLTVSKGEDECPYDYQQKIVVTGSSSSSYATMELLVWEDGEWKSEYSCSATVGRNGIGTNYGEGKGITPEGIFKLGVVLSARSISNRDWPCEIIDSDTCIIDDASSQYYNTIMDIDGIPRGTGYDNIGDTIVNGDTDKCMYIEHNGDGYSTDNVIPGKGSAITICGKTSSIHATAGCVDIASSDFNALLSMLDYSKNPHIEIVS